ncbi:hypothetical protein [Bradyrhizobium ottawaense]|uniref:hypothetical protein n=1 Tax=Bradyrhizobium ottawaense TaxID=931866 RepID=UPI003477C937
MALVWKRTSEARCASSVLGSCHAHPPPDRPRRLRRLRGRPADWPHSVCPRPRAAALLWTVTVTIPGPPFGDADSIDQAKARFKAAWLAFKEQHSADQLAKASAAMNHANRPGRYQRRRAAPFNPFALKSVYDSVVAL